MKTAFLATAALAIVLLAGCTTTTTEPRAQVTCSGDEHMTPYGCRRKS